MYDHRLIPSIQSATAVFRVARWVLVGVSLVVLAGGALAVVRTMTELGRELTELGWGVAPLHAVVACQRDTQCRAALRSAFNRRFPWLWIGILFVGCTAGAAVTSSAKHGDGVHKPPGVARWATRRDLRRLLRPSQLSPPRGYLGVVRGAGVLRPPEHLRCSHTLVIGGTGAGKSTAYFKPNLVADALDGCSAVVFDLKYPDLKSGLLDVVPVFLHQGHRVQLFLPFDDHSLQLPLLAGAEDSITAAMIADILCPFPEQVGDGGFFIKQQRALLHGLILGFARTGEDDMGRLVQLLLSGTAEVKRYVLTHPNDEVRQRLGGLFEQEKRIREGIVRGLVEELEMFTDPRLARATRRADQPSTEIQLAALGRQPTLFYLGIPQEELLRSRGQRLLQLIKRCLDRSLIQTANQGGGRLPVHTSVYLDEFVALGELPNVGENLATMRSRNVAYHLSVQNRIQGEARYGALAFRAFIAGNIGQMVLFPRYLDFLDARYFSQVLGEVAAVDAMTGMSRRHIFEWPRHDRRHRLVSRPLLSADELRQWPEGSGILLQNGVPPAHIDLPRLDQPSAPRRLRQAYTAGFLHPFGELTAADIVQATLHNCQMMPKQPLTTPSAHNPTHHVDLLKAESPRGDPELSAPQSLQMPNTVAAYRRWFAELVDSGTPLDLTMRPERAHEVAQIRVAKPALRPELARVKDLENWSTQQWITVQDDSIVILPAGLKVLDPGWIKRAVVRHRTQMLLVKPAVTSRKRRRVTIESEADPASQLRSWIAEHAASLEGHPLYQQSDQGEVPRGYYRPAALTLTNQVARDAFGTIPQSWPRIRLHNQRGVQILLSNLPPSSPVRRWFYDNRHRFEGHPTFAGGTSLGRYQAESVALSRDEYQHILGYLPADLSDVRVRLGKPRRQIRLLRYVFGDG
jgi:type IV secretion system protein VirD4